MRNTRRNIPDPISPQNPVIRKDISEGDNRLQDELEDKTSVEEIYSETDENKKNLKKQNKSFENDSDVTITDESGL